MGGKNSPTCGTKPGTTTPGFRLRWGSHSITGNFRSNNEDRLFIDPQGRFFVVADGMGGQSAGERASQLATEIVPLQLTQALNFQTDTPEKVAAGIDVAVSKANADIMALAEITPDCHNMGTTIALMVASGQQLYVAGVGDSRVYRVRGTAIEQLTTDHSLSEALRKAGTISKEEAAVHRYKHVLVRYLGSKEGGTGALAEAHLPQIGDRYMICSDGVTDGLPDDRIAELLRSAESPESACHTLIAAAQEGGSKDNITCVTVFVEAC